MVRVKICGITNIVDALLASQLGVDALGFIFYPPSPRYIHPEAARKIVQALPPFVTTVGVFVNHEIQEVLETMQLNGIDLAQLHGEESPEYCRHLSCKVIKAFRIKEEQDLKALSPYRDHVQAFLLDTKVEQFYGGTGQTFPWELARKVSSLGRIILAGGLNSQNIKEAIATGQPYAVDLNSGVEIAPGLKDQRKMATIMELIREVRYATR